jgi:tRNA (mo5U34)-methyltransferase
MSYSKSELETIVDSVPYWFHSIDLGHGVVTPGYKSAEVMRAELPAMHIPDVNGKTVLDINCWDGFYSFEAERRGAARVVALDWFAWFHYMKEAFPESELPGKAGFDAAHKALNSNVESMAGDFMELDTSTLGTFDVVFFLGSLYHMENPLGSMRRVAAVTKEVAVIETEAIYVPSLKNHALCEFYPTNELNNDHSNWWAPTEAALVGICKAAGFVRVEVISGSPKLTRHRRLLNSLIGRKITPYRAIVHAWK